MGAELGLLIEDFTTVNGSNKKRVRSSVFVILSMVSLILGLVLLNFGYLKLGILCWVTVFPILLLYPIIRFLFGGKDSLVAVVGTVVVEEVIKSQIVKKIEKAASKKKKY